MSNLSEYVRYCSKCASDKIEVFDQRHIKCSNCKFEWYQNVASSVAVIIEYGGEIMFTVRNQMPGKGMLDLPGGFMEYFETPEQAACRELKEELDIEINPNELKYLCAEPNEYIYNGVIYHTCDIVYLYHPSQKSNGYDAVEISSVEWIDKYSIDLQRMAFPSLRRALERFINYQ